ncbi:peptidoglycan DD-metalloendopeptidase family protein [Thaumasiovibrio sp. DFM-14]|uniref:peptidoglycan DD-metalloendopeptidase family protein n=1 Tax=Thaumasiovibrio sp. DFM-14 TaxID=3384792 RepID=UPI00399F60D2
MLLLTGCAFYQPSTSHGKDYQTLERGSYRGSYYEVNKGDTLYFISYITDRNVNDLIEFNNLEPPHTIFPGQKLRLWRPRYVAPEYGSTPAVVSAAVAPVVTASAPVKVKPQSVTPRPVSEKVATQQPTKIIPSAHKSDAKTIDSKNSTGYSQGEGKQVVNKNTPPAKVEPVKPKPEPKPKTPANTAKVSQWHWPTKGRVVSKFSDTANGNKGIDIAGQRGQTISATAGGTVVYAGNALRGYGNLIIIKHNDDYLSAYAHNEKLLVKENQSVSAGQKIATMGSSGAQSVMLHFEIRYKGKSVDPMRYLN